MALHIALRFREQLPSIVVEELDNILAGLQAQVGETTVTYVPTIRRGTLTIPNGSANAVLSLSPAVADPLKSELRYLGFSSADNVAFTGRKHPRLELDVSGTFLRADLGDNANGDMIIGWEITEWTATA